MPDNTDDLQVRRSGGRFSKGFSGNPGGRPKGARNRVTARCVELLGDESDAIIARLIRDAKKGEPVALRLAVERLVPVRAARDRVVEVELPIVERARDLASAAAAVIQHAALGDITLSEAREFMALLEGHRRVIETTDLAVRIDVLEGRSDGYADAAPRPGGEEVAARVRRLMADDRAREREELCG